MAEKQCTLKDSITFKGKGLHTGIDVTMTLKPAPDSHGYIFRRIDLPGQPLVNALAENAVDTARGTTLEENGVRVSTVEHVLASLAGMKLDNVLIEINGPETPIMDGSARQYVEAIEKTGVVEQRTDRKYFMLKEKIEYYDDKNNIHIIAYPDRIQSINVLIDYNSKVLGNQHASLEDLKDFSVEIAPSRTFVFLHELEYLAKNNLIKGGDLDNAIVIVDRQVTQEELDHLAEVLNKPRIKVQPEGILNNIELRFPNEPARHKLLDMVGDLALVGRWFKAKIIATRPGHHSNIEFARILRQIMKKTALQKQVPLYNPNLEPILDINEVKRRLPHRPPFLLIDKVIHLDEKSVVCIKNVTMNEPFFVGHFPDEPIMPGVLQIEAAAQAGGMLVMGTVPDPENYTTYFLKIDKVRFKNKVVPGDTLILKMDLLEPIRRGIALMFAEVFVGNKLVMEGEMMAQIVKVK
ncbi:MAG: bifunctional UDP-3-O-[3-hydroxymyristoyl] N-acetylglucosamine deacetylase/3-hydroxyacyl-ACP dehydratase [Bacteroidales bacterium]|nr:bifunctional UDP-3-O-[3-hydroxymyristoyl] N-acetylglucosamine deacetylase/3-hydroxyacyl-ACP dehydratase [Bacteroidales bacterium]MBN2697938.1 bifunctional UDP-3-O-[3-hydroxymyristoyl] N-acetylglucosamine deacetylase/3-hydroxyacyl-ACP dehydratase [Bacteroidales bacterium]